MWNAGFILYSILSYHPFGGFTDDQATQKAIERNKSVKSMFNFEGIDEIAQSLIKDMTTSDLEKRVSAREALDHEWFKMARWPSYHSDSI